jgi:hypothetical protein
MLLPSKKNHIGTRGAWDACLCADRPTPRWAWTRSRSHQPPCWTWTRACPTPCWAWTRSFPPPCWSWTHPRLTLRWAWTRPRPTPCCTSTHPRLNPLWAGRICTHPTLGLDTSTPNPTLGLDATRSNSMLDLDASAQPHAQHIIIYIINFYFL